MKITIIHGQSHEGSTYHIARILAKKLGESVTEFFLPKDFDQFCTGCTACFTKDEKKCPHYESLNSITKAIDDADVLILASPVYVYHVTGAMKSLLDHYGYRWMVHRPSEAMFKKQAVCIASAAGAGMKSTIRDMKDSLFFWGVGKIYTYGVAVKAVSFDAISPHIKNKIENKTNILAQKILSCGGNVKPSLKTIVFFHIMRFVQRKGWNEADSLYWKNKGWTEDQRPWK